MRVYVLLYATTQLKTAASRASATGLRSLPELQRDRVSSFTRSLAPLLFVVTACVRYIFFFLTRHRQQLNNEKDLLLLFFVRLNSLTRNGVNFLPVLVTFTLCRLGFLSSLLLSCPLLLLLLLSTSCYLEGKREKLFLPRPNQTAVCVVYKHHQDERWRQRPWEC